MTEITEDEKNNIIIEITNSFASFNFKSVAKLSASDLFEKLKEKGFKVIRSDDETS